MRLRRELRLCSCSGFGVRSGTGAFFAGLVHVFRDVRCQPEQSGHRYTRSGVPPDMNHEAIAERIAERCVAWRIFPQRLWPESGFLVIGGTSYDET